MPRDYNQPPGYKTKSCGLCTIEFKPTGACQKFCSNCKAIADYTRNDASKKKFRLEKPDRAMLGSMRTRLRKWADPGIVERLAELWGERSGYCELCGLHESETTNRLAVDHNHETNRFRGFLCVKCNTGLGAFRDDPELLHKAIRYLEERNDGDPRIH